VRTVDRPDLEVTRAVTKDGPSTDDNAANAGFKEHAMLAFSGSFLELSWPTNTWQKTSVTWNGKAVQAFGARGDFAIGRVPSIDGTIIQLPYKNTDYALLLLITNNKDTPLLEMVQKMLKTTFEKISETMKVVPAYVTVPCFQTSNVTNMKTVMQKYTVLKNVFTESADLTKLSSDNLYLDDVVQHTGFRMCTEGATSFSLTSAAFSSQRDIKESVVLDRPFLFALYNTVNKVILINGKIEQPVWEVDDDVTDTDSATIDIHTDVERANI
jgi:serpin B